MMHFLLMAEVMTNTCICYMQTKKDADLPAHLLSIFIIPVLERFILAVAIMKISGIWLASEVGQTGLSLTWCG